MLNQKEILSTIEMIDQQHLDIRTITMGISLLSCCDPDPKRACEKIYDKITRYAEKLVKTGEDIEREFGIPIVNKRISVTPMALVAGASETEDCVPFALALDRAAQTCGVNFIGGYSALVQKGMTEADEKLIRSIPEALARTELVCSSVNVGSTRAGINMDAVALMGRIVKDTAAATADRDGLGCAKLVVFCNAVEDNPFMAGAFHGVGEAEKVINVGVSGPGVVCTALKAVKGQPFDVVAETVKKTAFRVTRMGQLVAQEASRRLDTPFGIVDLSLAPTPAIGDSVARILEEMGLEVCGTHGTTAALALLNDAVKKGGVMASSSVGGLSGAFIPVSEDEGMIAAAEAGTLCLDKLEAMTCVCSVGLDMIAVPGDTPAETISAIIADEAAIGMVSVDLSLAPTPAIGDSVARILEEMGLEVCGTHGTTAALALLNDAVKKGGVMASSSVGGLSGAFIPVSEDEGMIAAAEAGTLCLDKLEAMTCVCSVGLDMIAVPGDTPAETISAIIADEAAIGMVNNKTTAVRLLPAPGKTVGDRIEMGGLLGSAPVMPVHPESSADFIARGGRIPAPLHSLKN